jgi:pentatricopeptide repeat protein
MGTQAIELYRQMPEELVDEVTYISVLNACSHSGLCEEARLIFKNIRKKTVKIYTTMVFKKDCCNNFE